MDKDIEETDVPLDRDVFFRRLLRDLSGTLESVVGLNLAEGYISTVGGQIGRWLDQEYRTALGKERLDAEGVAEVCVDLKRRIGGEFRLASVDQDKLVFVNSRCPFGKMVEDRPSLCMMTSNVFGRISADNLGYARVELAEAIARGDAGCRVIVHLKPAGAPGRDEREYYDLSEAADAR